MMLLQDELARFFANLTEVCVRTHSGAFPEE